MQARESGKAVLEPASARWPVFSVPNVLYVPETEFGFAESCCTKDHEFLARQIPKKSCCTKNHVQNLYQISFEPPHIFQTANPLSNIFPITEPLLNLF